MGPLPDGWCDLQTADSTSVSLKVTENSLLNMSISSEKSKFSSLQYDRIFNLAKLIVNAGTPKQFQDRQTQTDAFTDKIETKNPITPDPCDEDEKLLSAFDEYMAK